MKSFVNLSHRLFGNVSSSLKVYFLDMKEDLQKANITYTLEEYISLALFTVIITFIAEALLLAVIFGFLALDILTSMVLSFTLAGVLSALVFLLFYSYPKAKAKTRESKIKKVLPFSVSYMATVSSAKAPPIVIFDTLSKFKEYGEIAEESKNITRNVSMFGMTFSSAIKKQARRTPSKEFKDLLWGINTVVSSGSDLTFFLKQKSDQMMNEYRRRIRKYSQDLSLFVEIYLTLIITGSIFFVVLSSIMSAFSGGLGTIIIQSFVVFVLLPLLSIAFLIVIRSMSPTS